MVHPGQSSGHGGDHLPRVRGATLRQVASLDPLLPLDADQGEFVVDVDGRAGHVGDVGHHGIHRDVADERDARPPDEGVRTVGDGARPPVAVAERQRRDPARA
jgi:hypothetical protein